jgi:hypothetical protein
MATPHETQMLNEAFIDHLTTPGMEKKALDAVHDFTRTRVREEGFARRIVPMVPVNNSDLSRMVDSPNPAIIIDKEPGSPASVSMPYGTLPMSFYIEGPRWVAHFCRIMTPRATADLSQLRTWKMDIRQVISDNMVKDMMYKEDSPFLAAVNQAIGGAADATVAASGAVQWETIYGGVTNDTVEEALKILPKLTWHLESKVVLVNNITIREINKWGREEVGGDWAEELTKNGFAEMEFKRNKWVVTIKRNLVPDNAIYMFADPGFIGKSYSLEDTTMYLDRKAFMIEWFFYEEIGGGIGHTGGLARADFA